MPMQLEFIPVEEFYFALTLAVRTLDDLEKPGLVALVREHLLAEYGQPSTVVSGKQNTFNYVFRVLDVDNSPSPGLIVSIADYQDKLRLGSDYGWMLDPERKPIRTDNFSHREQFAQELQQHLQQSLQLPLS
jgi:hypothetical protein